MGYTQTLVFISPMFCVLRVVGRPHLVMFRSYLFLHSGITLALLGRTYGMPGIKPSWPCTRQASYLLCYHYGPALQFFYLELFIASEKCGWATLCHPSNHNFLPLPTVMNKPPAEMLIYIYGLSTYK